MNECPYLHPGEKARRRDPRVWSYQTLPCPDFRKGTCKRGDACVYSHGVFECYLHPLKYRTTLCKEGAACSRSVCFFAHSIEQLREPTMPHTLSCSSSTTKTTTATAAAITGQTQHHHLSLPPIRVSALKSHSSCCDLHHPSSPGSILQHQANTTCTEQGRNFSSSSLSCDTSSNGTSRCASPGAMTAAAAMENIRQASMSLPSSIDSSLASTPLMSEAAVAAGAGLEFCLPASLDILDDRLNNAEIIKNSNLYTHSNNKKEEDNRSADVAMAAAVALRAQQQQQASAAAAAQADLARIKETAAARGVAVGNYSQYKPTSAYSTFDGYVVQEEKSQEQQQSGEELALQQLMAGLGL